MAPRGTAVDTDGRVALQLTAKPVTSHEVVVALQLGASRPQPWQDPAARVLWRDLPTLQATIWPWGEGRQLPGALPWLLDCPDASPPPAKMRSALQGLYRACSESGVPHHFLVATDHGAELCDNTVVLVAEAAQCLAPHAMILRREGWEGQQYWKVRPPPSSLSMWRWAARSSCTLTARWSSVCGTGLPTTSWPPTCR